MAFHLAMREERLREAGASERDARAAARRRFGNSTLLKETCRELWTFASVERWLADLRYAARVLAKQRAFTAVAVISLALGIGANTAVLSVARAALLQPLAVLNPQQLRVLKWGYDYDSNTRPAGFFQFFPDNFGNETTNFSYPGYQALRARCGGAADLFAFAPLEQLNLAIGGRPVSAAGLSVSDNYFQALGVGMALGRPLTESDYAPDAPPAAVISYRAWTREFGLDAAVIGKAIAVNGLPFTVVGVTARGFYGVSKGGFFPSSDVMVPLTAQPRLAPSWNPETGSLFHAEDYLWLRVMARVKPGTDDRALLSALNLAYTGYVRGSSAAALREVRSPQVHAYPAATGVDTLNRSMQTPLVILGGVAVLVLLIACLNLANLTLARGMARQREMHIRLALGSGRLRLVRQLLAESLLLALAGGAAGLLVATFGGRLLITMLTARQGPVVYDGSPDWTVLGMSVGISVVAALLFGLVPAFRLTAARSAAVLKYTATGIVTSRLGVSRFLMVGQVALSIVLLAGAAMFVRTLLNLANVPLGFNPRGLMLFQIDPSLNGYERDRVERVYATALERLQLTPGVVSATVLENALLSGWNSTTSVSVDGSKPIYTQLNGVGPRFFETMQIPLVGGRGFDARDTTQAPGVAVVNETAARAFFGNTSPLGRTFRRFGYGRKWPIEVVGVAKDSKYDRLRKPVEPTIFVPYLQSGGSLGGLWVAVRTTSSAPAAIRTIGGAMRSVDPQVPMREVKTQLEQIDETIGSERFFARVLVFFGLFALLIACIGLHAVTAYSATRRTSEIGIRIAFGATRGEVLWMVLRQVVVMTGIGLALGVPLAMAAGRVVRSMLFGVEPGDPTTIVVAIAVMAAVALLAGWLPARRASRMDPVSALRYE